MKSIYPYSYVLVTLILFAIFYLSIYPKLISNQPAENTFDISNDKIFLPKVTLSEAEKVRLIAKSPKVHEYYSFDDEGLNIYASAKDKAELKNECKVYCDEFEIFEVLFRKLTSEQLEDIYVNKGIKRLNSDNYKHLLKKSKKKTGELPLSGVRIALDPGHLGGSMKTAMLEGKFIRIKEKSGRIVEFNEGNINLKTAKLLAYKLRANGAQVFLTKEEEGMSAFGITYHKWLKTDFEGALDKAFECKEITKWQYQKLKEERDEKEIFEVLFKKIELEERARKINTFAPHICVVIHYNVDEANYILRDRDNQLLNTTEANYSMVFIPGAFLENELQKVKARIELMRLLMTENLAESLRLSDYIMEEIEGSLKVKPILSDNPMGYIQNVSVYTGKEGVFARNLVMTRLIHAPIAYTEPLCQDNKQEYLRLANGSRAEEVAEAYYRGILAYFSSKVK